MRINRKTLFVIGDAIVVLVIVWIAACRFGGFRRGVEFCTTCGCERYSDKTLWIDHSRIRETGISRFHNQRIPKREHTHEWLYAYGGGSGICSIGNGSVLSPAIHDASLPVSLERIRSVSGQDVADKWQRRLLDPAQSMHARSSLSVMADQTGDFQSDLKAAEHSFEFCQRMVAGGDGVREFPQDPKSSR